MQEKSSTLESDTLLSRVRSGIAWRTAPFIRKIDNYFGSKGIRRISLARDRWLHRVSDGDVRAAVASAVGTPITSLLVHSSLSSCGHLAGGAAAAIEAFDSVAENVVLPTHTYCYPSAPGAPAATFHPQTTDSLVGAITNHFWRMPQARRSIHPSHSLAICGPLADELLLGHERCDTPCGRGTPYERLVEGDSAVLMFGATMNTYTLFHTAEDAAHCPYLYCPEPVDLRALDYEGQLHTIAMRRQDMSVRRRFEPMDDVLEGQGLLRRTRLGRGELLFMPSSKAVHEFVTEHLARDPFYLVDPTYRREVESRCE